jgi:hypothetical protein
LPGGQVELQDIHTRFQLVKQIKEREGGASEVRKGVTVVIGRADHHVN